MLTIGDKAPTFTSVDQDGNPVKLEDFKGKKLILYFYPKDNTPGCTAEACNLNENLASLTSKGFAILGVSPDPASSHLKFIAKFNLGFRLIADVEKLVAKTYEAWGEKSMYGKKYEGILRTTYIIDEDGTISHIFKKVDTKNHTAQILKEIDK
mgnify:CR=1 FL=1